MAGSPDRSGARWPSRDGGRPPLEAVALLVAIVAGCAAVVLAYAAWSRWEREGMLSSQRPVRLLAVVAVSLALGVLVGWGVRAPWPRPRVGLGRPPRERPVPTPGGPGPALAVVVIVPLLVAVLEPDPAPGRLRALSTSGVERWAATVGALVSDPVVVGDVAVVLSAEGCGRDGQVEAFDAATGAGRWSRRIDAVDPWSPVPARQVAVVGDVIVAADGHEVVGLDGATGATRWVAPVAATVGPVASGARFVVVTEGRPSSASKVASGDADLRSTITAWEPGGALAWRVDLAGSFQTLDVTAEEGVVAVHRWGPLGVVEPKPRQRRVTLDASTGTMLADHVTGSSPGRVRREAERTFGDLVLRAERGHDVGCTSGHP